MKRLHSIQNLRFIAASLIVVFHIMGIEKIYGDPDTLLLSWFDGQYGVDIFFIISGFIMVYVTHNKPRNTQHFKVFLSKRVIRIVPVYWFYTFLMVILLHLVPQAFRDTQFDIMRILKSLFFVPQKQNPLVSIGWTLNYEMYFYLLFSAFLLLPQRALLPVSSVLFIALSIFGRLCNSQSPAIRFLSDPLILEFLIGMYISYFYLRDRYLAKGMAWAFTLVGILVIALSFFVKWGGHRLIYWGIPSGLIVMGTLSLERHAYPFSRMFSKLGDSSYSLYLSHPFTLFAVGKLLALLGLSGYLYNVLLILLAFVTSVIVGVLSFRIIEKSSSRVLTRKFVRRKL